MSKKKYPCLGQKGLDKHYASYQKIIKQIVPTVSLNLLFIAPLVPHFPRIFTRLPTAIVGDNITMRTDMLHVTEVPLIQLGNSCRFHTNGNLVICRATGCSSNRNFITSVSVYRGEQLCQQGSGWVTDHISNVLSGIPAIISLSQNKTHRRWT